MKLSILRALAVGAVLAAISTAILAFPRTTDAAAGDNSSLLAVVTTENQNAFCSHIVQRGEALYMIAARYGTTTAFLAQLNKLYNPNYIYAGMVLRVPCGPNPYPQPQPYPYPQPCGQPCPQPYPQPQPHPKPYPQPSHQICSYYIVQRGDWLKTIAYRFGVTWELLARVNGLYNANYIYAGQRLAIPCAQPYPPPPPPPPPPPYYPTVVPPPYYPTPIPTPFPPLMNIVEIKDNYYNPAVITIRVGQYVQWINQGKSQHTVTQGLCPGGVCTPTPGGFNSGVLNPGGTYGFQFNQVGTFAYFCQIHGASMVASVAVTP